MRTIRTKVYKFEELVVDAQQNAIEEIRNDYYENNDFGSWAVDDCSLFEPKQEELDLIGFTGELLIENTRESIYFTTDQNRFLDCAIAMQVTNDDLFLKWLGIDRNLEGLGDITFNIFTSGYRNADTTIDFDDYPSMYDNLIENATKKFDNHIQDVLKRIEADIDYRFTDEAIIDDIEANDYEFLSNGKRY